MKSLYSCLLLGVAICTILIFATDVEASCRGDTSISTGFMQCKAKVASLETLFTSNKKTVKKSDNVQNALNLPTQIPLPTRSPNQKINLARSSAPTDSIRVPTGKIGRADITSNSTNKRLSKFGPDAPAQFTVRCHERQLNVVLNFPGYPMNNQKYVSPLYYNIDTSKTRAAQFRPANEFSAMGIWQNKKAYVFLASISKGNNLFISTQDLEETLITAKFHIPDIFSKLEKLDGNCHLPI